MRRGLVLGLVAALAALAAAGVWAWRDAPAPRAASPGAVSPQDEALEAEVRQLARQLACLVCPGQSLAESRSAWAEARKDEIRAMLRAGMDPKQVLQAMAARYGTGILLAPPARGPLLLVWAVPVLALAAGAAVVAAWLARARRRAGAGAREEQP